MGEPEPDVMRIHDTGTAEEMPYDDLSYAYFGGYQWLDDGRYAALGLDETEAASPVDILSCTVATGDCTVVAEDVASLDDGFAIPNGLYLN